MALLFFASLDMAEIGIPQAQALYFRNVVAIWHYPDQWPLAQFLSWIALPIPGGYLLGPLLIANLICSHLRSFRRTVGHVGLLLLHAGILGLIAGQAITDHAQRIYLMGLEKNTAITHAISPHRDELVVINSSQPKKTQELRFPDKSLRPGVTLSHPDLPFQLKVLDFHANSTLQSLNSSPSDSQRASATHGVGRNLQVIPRPRSTQSGISERHLASAQIEAITSHGSLGVWLVNTAFEGQIPAQPVPEEDSPFAIELRVERHMLPFALTLLRNEQTTYPGTDIPKSMTSWIQLDDPRSGASFQTTLSPNQPLRHAGYHLYQISQSRGEPLLQVVRNPARLMPYLSLTLVIAGLSILFASKLSRFLKHSFPP